MRSFFLALAIVAATPVLLMAGTGFGVGGGQKQYNLNNAVGKNSLEFLSDAPMEHIKGTADGITGNFKLDADNLEATTGTITVAVQSMKTAVAKRDAHMYSSTWLDAEKYPNITFTLGGLKNVKVSADGSKLSAKAQATGTFSLHGQTKQITADVSIVFLKESAETKKRASGNLVLVTATFNVALADYAITGKQGVVGNSVGEVINITTTLFANS